MHEENGEREGWPEVTKPFSPDSTHRLHFFTKPVLVALLHLLWVNIPAKEPLILIKTANYNANVTKQLREIKI